MNLLDLVKDRITIAFSQTGEFTILIKNINKMKYSEIYHVEKKITEYDYCHYFFENQL